MSNDSLRRIMAEVKEFNTLNKCANTFFHALPLESDLFEWHFTVRGPPDTAFADGVYHGRILLPAEYPLKPPEIILLTQNGRFEVGKRICLSVTAHHQETWQPSWGIRTILTALVGFMPSKAEGVGALDYPDEDRRRLARKSWNFHCDRCGARPIQQLIVPAAVASGFVGAKSPPATSSASSSPVSVVSVPQPTSLQAPVDCVAPSVTQDPPASSFEAAAPEVGAVPNTTTTPDIASDSRLENLKSSAPPSAKASVAQASSSSFPAPSTSSRSSSMETGFKSSASASSAQAVQSNAGATSSRDLSSSERTPSTEAVPRTKRTTASTSRNASRNIREPELLLLACAIGVVIVAIILRRVFIIALQ